MCILLISNIFLTTWLLPSKHLLPLNRGPYSLHHAQVLGIKVTGLYAHSSLHWFPYFPAVADTKIDFLLLICLKGLHKTSTYQYNVATPRLYKTLIFTVTGGENGKMLGK